ncbi:MAG TPA: GntR family transcriptional regulator [Syntrophomonadaceae bacterium]|nr:GntR family transcriptional regulator [Syntrophomonadaceae bacterium]
MQPLYYRIAEDIIKQIKKGKYQPGDMLPSESQLCEEYNTSKMTVRQGLALLAQAGYLRSVPGKGNFVEYPRYDLLTLQFDEMDIISDYQQGVKLLDVTIVDPDPQVQGMLSLPNKEKVIVMKRLLFSDDQAVAYDIKYMPYIKGKPFIEKELQYIPFAKMVAKHGELFSVKNEVTICAEACDEETAELLGIAQGSPLLVIEQKLFSAEQKPIGWGKIFCRSDFVQLHAVSAQYIKEQKLLNL